mmetsp:Transcript_20274/g.44285  ORF Transcript_20274/g.44285 Transcript_20274/m.44285 type:complete len:466 (-) Transcript_20274:144-1541(-)
MTTIQAPVKLIIPVESGNEKENAAPPASIAEWKPPSPSKVALDSKLNTAATKKRTLTSSLVKKLSRRNKNKADKAIIKAEEEARRALALSVKSDDKIAAASKKKETKEAARVTEISTKNNQKVLSATEAKHQAKSIAQDAGVELEQKLSAARERKDLMVAEQVDTLVQARQEKAARIEEIKIQEEHQAREVASRSSNKIAAAASRRDKHLQEKQPSPDICGRVLRIEEIKAKEDEDAAALREKVDTKLSAASERRDKALSSKVAIVSDKAKANAQRVDGKKTNAEMATLSLRQLLDEKQARAEQNRAEFVSSSFSTRGANASFNTSASFSSSALSTPTKTPTLSREEIDRKLREASARREAILTMRAEAAGFKVKHLGGGEMPNLLPNGDEDDDDVVTDPFSPILSVPPVIVRGKQKYNSPLAVEPFPDYNSNHRPIAEPAKFDLWTWAWGHVVGFIGKLFSCWK